MKKIFFTAIITFFCVSAACSSEKEVFEIILKKAQSGDAESQYRAALSYMFDKRYADDQSEKAPDYKKAFYLLSESAQNGYSKAMFLLGRVYELGRGTKIDTDKALFWYKKAVDAGEEDAICPLAKLYSKGDVFPKDPEVSRKCFMK